MLEVLLLDELIVIVLILTHSNHFHLVRLWLMQRTQLYLLRVVLMKELFVDRRHSIRCARRMRSEMKAILCRIWRRHNIPRLRMSSGDKRSGCRWVLLFIDQLIWMRRRMMHYIHQLLMPRVHRLLLEEIVSMLLLLLRVQPSRVVR